MKFIDLFAGIGGFRLGLEAAGHECVFSSEIDKFAQQTYQANFGDAPHGDITKIKEEDIPAHDIICAGFPCQAFSISGKQLGFDDARGTLFFDIIRIAKFHKPKVLFLENVKNLASHDEGKTLSVILSVLDDLGYDVEYQVLNAVHYGALTARERIYLVCFRKDLKIKFEFPKPTESKASLKGKLDKGKKSAYIINKAHILSIPDNLPKGADYPIRVGSFNKGGQGDRIYSINGPAITLSAYGGGTASKTGAYLVGKNQIRRLTPRECARVMGFPDSFKIHPNKNQAYKQFGNSVAVPVIKAIANNIIGIIHG